MRHDKLRPKFRPHSIPEHAHPFVKHLYHTMNAQEMTIFKMELVSGVCGGTIKHWRNRGAPTIDNLMAALNAVGLTLKIDNLEK